MKENPLKPWLLAFRFKTLPAALAPVFLGTGLAYGDGVHHWPSACIALFGALTIQIGTNLANDYFDHKKGADTSERVGPVRVMQAGLVSPTAMKCAIGLMFGLAALAAVWLYLRAGWPIAVIGITAILSGILYTAGPFPLGYIGLGELFVFIFFGPVAVAGTYYVQSLEMNGAIILSGIAPGLLSTAILAVNNLRDIETDRRSGKMTLAARFGAEFARLEYLVLVLGAGVMPSVIFWITRDHILVLSSVFVLLAAVPTIATVFFRSGPALNKALAQTGVVLLGYCAVFAVGWLQ